MITIGIDISLSSTAITIHKNNKFKYFSYNNIKNNNKWIKLSSEIINYHHFTHETSKDFSISEVLKIKQYDLLADKIIFDILNEIKEEKTNIFIESYSYSSKAGKLIDIVSFSTLIRVKLLKYSNITLNFIPPSTLKKKSGELIYEKDKKNVIRDENGKSSGSFDKNDLLKIINKLNINDNYINFIKNNYSDIISMKKIPKPYDDINDSLLLVLINLEIKK